jgi:hypothetical protein
MMFGINGPELDALVVSSCEDAGIGFDGFTGKMHNFNPGTDSP